MSDYHLPRRSIIFVCLVAAGALHADQARIAPGVLTLGYVRDLVWDATRGRLYACIGSSVVAIDPETATVVDTIVSGVAVDRLAVSADGSYLYAAVGSRGVIQRYQIANHNPDLEINLGTDAQGRYLTAYAIAVLPDQPQSILIAKGYWPGLNDSYFAVPGVDIEVFDGFVQRPGTAPVGISSLYVRPANGLIYGWGTGHLYRLSIDAHGVSVNRSSPLSPYFAQNSPPTWNGALLADRTGSVVDLDSGTARGGAAIRNGCGLTPDSQGGSIFAAERDNPSGQGPMLARYSLETFQPVERARILNSPDFLGACDFVSGVWSWGTDGIAISSFQHSGGGSILVLFHASGFDPVAPTPAPEPQTDTAGIIRLALTVNDLSFDATRNLVWATVSGMSAALANSVVSIEPATGRIVDVIPAGSEPGPASLSGDGSHLFVTQLAPEIGVLDLNAKQRVSSFSVLDDHSWAVSSIAAVPNAENSVVVVSQPYGVSYASSVSIFDNGVRRPQSSSNFKFGSDFGTQSSFITAIIPGELPGVFYGIDGQVQSAAGAHDIFRLRADTNGISLEKRVNTLNVTGARFGVALSYDSGNFFTGGGELWNVGLDQLQGTFAIRQSYASGGIPIPFAEQNRVAYAYYSGLTGEAAITMFDLTTKRPISTLPLKANVTRAVRAGSGMLALVADGQIMLVPV